MLHFLYKICLIEHKNVFSSLSKFFNIKFGEYVFFLLILHLIIFVFFNRLFYHHISQVLFKNIVFLKQELS